MPSNSNNLMTALEASKIIGVTRCRVLQFAAQGRLPFTKLGDRKFFDRSEVRRFSRKKRPTGRPKQKNSSEDT